MNKRLEDIPFEVMQVVCVMASRIPIGMEMFNKMQETIKKYPKYFPWEHKYNSIPKEVHEAFLKECYPESFTDGELELKGGLMDQINRESTTVSMCDLRLLLNDFDREQQEIAEKESDREKEKQRIWKKHYGKFKLEYRRRL